jgi:hypothetical protein
MPMDDNGRYRIARSGRSDVHRDEAQNTDEAIQRSSVLAEHHRFPALDPRFECSLKRDGELASDGRLSILHICDDGEMLTNAR